MRSRNDKIATAAVVIAAAPCLIAVSLLIAAGAIYVTPLFLIVAPVPVALAMMLYVTVTD
jgi:hypothetical protein